MELQFVNFEQAKKLKEIGFPYIASGMHYSLNYPIERRTWDNISWDWEELEPIMEEGVLFCNGAIEHEANSDMCVSAPTLELVTKWLRDEMNIHINVAYEIPCGKNHCFGLNIYDGDTCILEWISKNEYETYEEALNEGIDHVIEYIFNKKKEIPQEGESYHPTEEDYWKLEKEYRDLENRYITLYNKYCRKPLEKRIGSLTDEERREIVSGKFLECIKPITNVRKGSGCEIGENYWFEYVHDTNDGENPDADAFYRKLSDNNHYDEVYITDEELFNNFREI